MIDEIITNERKCEVCNKISDDKICHKCTSRGFLSKDKGGGKRYNSEHLVRRKKQEQINKLKSDNKYLLFENKKMYKELLKMKKILDGMLNNH